MIELNINKGTFEYNGTQNTIVSVEKLDDNCIHIECDTNVYCFLADKTILNGAKHTNSDQLINQILKS